MNSSHPANSPPRIGLITNPHSRRNRAHPGAVQAIVANHPNIHHQVTPDRDAVPRALRDFAQQGVNVLAINGGDGTTSQVFTELFNGNPFPRLPSVILLPGGTTNMNVGDVGIRGSLQNAVRRMADWAGTGKGHVQRLNRVILRIEGSVDGNTVYGMSFGAGTVIRGIEYCHSNVHTMGIKNELGPGLTTLRTIWGMARKEPCFSDPIPIRIELDDIPDPQVREVVLITINSLQRLFLGIKPHWGKEDAPLYCTWVQKPARRVFRAFFAVLRGKPNRHVNEENGYFSHNAQKIRLWLDGSFALDGEIYQAAAAQDPVTVSNGGDVEFMRIG
ncbi:MAG: diacylglycerol/lipid kinase family protein [Thiogranum sp.]